MGILIIFSLIDLHWGFIAPPPIVTILSFSLAGILGGAFITETILGIPGVGRFSVESIFNRDYPVIMAITLISAVAFIFANLLADISYSIIDPRIKISNV